MNIRCVVCNPIDPLVMCSCSRPSAKREVKGVNYVCLTLVVFVFIASCSWVASRVEAAAIDERVVPVVVTADRDAQASAAPTVIPVPVAEIIRDFVFPAFRTFSNLSRAGCCI